MRTFLLVTVSALSITSAQAGSARDTLSAVAKCAEIPTTAERLQCYDAAAAGAKALLADADKQAEAKQESEGGVLAWFGFAPEQKPVTKPEDFGIASVAQPKPNAPAEITEISAKVLEFAKNAHGKALFVLDNGQVWKQIDGDTTEVHHRESQGPMQIRIEKAFMGSFSLYIEGKTLKVKVRRLK